jgi:hypothetical protein
MEETIADAGRRMLFLIRNYYTDERHIAVAGEGGRWDVMAFKGDMTQGVEDIEVQSGSGMPEIKAAKQAAIERILQMIMQNNPTLISARDLRKVTQEFQVGGLEAFFRTSARTLQQVEDENRRLSAGEPLPINSYDDDEAHVSYHTDFQKTSSLPGAPPRFSRGSRTTSRCIATGWRRRPRCPRVRRRTRSSRGLSRCHPAPGSAASAQPDDEQRRSAPRPRSVRPVSVSTPSQPGGGPSGQP